MSQSSDKIWLSPPHMCGKEIEFIHDAFNTNWIAPLGPHVDGFEKDICNFLEIQNCTALSSGTAALHLALILLNVQPDDFIICPSFTFSASANPILYEKAVPVFIDSEPETWNMDPQLLRDGIEFCLSRQKKPKAIIVVHLYGMPAKLDDIASIASEYEIPLIEDAAESIGSTYKNKFTGTFGAIGILSFNGNKIITTSGGGALISNDQKYTERAKFLATQARDPAPHYQHSQIGYNYRLSNICAAIGRGQMTVLNDRIRSRRNNFDYYLKRLSSNQGISFLIEPDQHVSNRWLTTCLIDKTVSNVSNDQLRTELSKNNIESRPLWKPLHLQPVFSDFPAFLNGNSAAYFNAGICLPSGSNLSDQDLDRICTIIEEALT